MPELNTWNGFYPEGEFTRWIKGAVVKPWPMDLPRWPTVTTLPFTPLKLWGVIHTQLCLHLSLLYYNSKTQKYCKWYSNEWIKCYSVTCGTALVWHVSDVRFNVTHTSVMTPRAMINVYNCWRLHWGLTWETWIFITLIPWSSMHIFICDVIKLNQSPVGNNDPETQTPKEIISPRFPPFPKPSPTHTPETMCPTWTDSGWSLHILFKL